MGELLTGTKNRLDLFPIEALCLEEIEIRVKNVIEKHGIEL